MQKIRSLKRIIDQKSKIIIGLNSGTSADGIDAAIVRINGSGLKSRVEFLSGATYKFSSTLRARILRYAERDFADGIKWLELDAELAGHFASACKKIVRKAGLKLEDIDLIGSHGQTIRHMPHNKNAPLTLQIADPSRISVLTGITTVGDFRIADIAAGGEGAPLTPIVNAILFRKVSRRIAVLNIGGIANISVIKSSSKALDIFGCDTGPGNMLIDYLARRLYRRPFDENGRIASKGKPDLSIIRKVLSSIFFNTKGPRSAGREDFGKVFAEAFLLKCKSRKLSKPDMLATASVLTLKAVEKCVKINHLNFDKMILTGGGVKNRFLTEGLASLLPQVEIRLASDYNYPEDYLEAISFAVLGNEALCSNKYDLKMVTGASMPVVPGKICQG